MVSSMSSKSSQLRVRKVKVRKIIGRKSIKDKTYQYEYYTLPLNIYIPRNVVERWGTEFVVIRDDESGTITIMPRKLAEEKGLKVD